MYVYVCLCICMYMYVYVCICICMYMYVYVCICMYMYVYVYVCICMYMYVYVCICCEQSRTGSSFPSSNTSSAVAFPQSRPTDLGWMRHASVKCQGRLALFSDPTLLQQMASSKCPAHLKSSRRALSLQFAMEKEHVFVTGWSWAWWHSR